MDHQKKERLGLLHWAQAMHGDCAKAKELAKEWQKVGRYSSKVRPIIHNSTYIT